jgi:molybdopterin-guanine dinucleotide biosynthesis protein A
MECFVLAGGRSRRFGENKLLFSIGGEKLIEHVVKTLKPVCKRLCLVVKNREEFDFLADLEIIEDIVEKQFALAGVYTALKATKGKKALIVSGDMPLLSRDVILYLWEHSEPPITLYKIGGRYYPLLGVYYKDVLNSLEQYIISGGEKVLQWVQNVGFKEIGEDQIRELDPELLSFVNVNTREDAEIIIKRYGGEGLES